MVNKALTSRDYKYITSKNILRTTGSVLVEKYNLVIQQELGSSIKWYKFDLKKDTILLDGVPMKRFFDVISRASRISVKKLRRNKFNDDLAWWIFNWYEFWGESGLKTTKNDFVLFFTIVKKFLLSDTDVSFKSIVSQFLLRYGDLPTDVRRRLSFV